jgi:cytochrome c55X
MRSLPGVYPSGHKQKHVFLLQLCLTTASCLADPTPSRQDELRELLKNDCGACHGLTLQGGMGPALLPENLAEKPDELLVTTLLKGRQGTAMPPWQPFMNREEAVWLVGLLRKIK